MFRLDNFIIDSLKDLFSNPYKQFAIMAIISVYVVKVFPEKKESK